jgi:hypothetical protein
MSVNVAKRRTRSQPRLESGISALPIGEINQTVFACPACARPLVMGTGHCPGCGTRLLIGVEAKKASIFIIIGLVIGALFGGAATAIASAIGGDHHAPAVVSGPVVSPSPRASGSSASPSPASTPVRSVDPAVSPIAGSALVGAIGVDTRLAASQTALEAALAARRFDVTAVSQSLRALSADAVIGLKLTPHLDAWAASKSVGADLTTLYTAVQGTAAEGLAASIRNEAGYRAAAKQMVSLLRGLGGVDTRARDLATQSGLVLADTAQVATPTP